MNSLIYQLFFLILIYIKPIHNHYNGAPSSACTSMTPSHGSVTSQACSNKYTIQSDKSQYYTNETVQITVNGTTANDMFKGVLLIAKTETSEQIIGTWTIVDSNLQAVDCNGTSNTGVTHTSSSDKSSIQAIWTPPSIAPTERTVIKATIVQAFTLIYVNCFNVILTNRQNIASTTGITRATAAVSATNNPSTTVITTTTPETDSTGAIISWTYANGVTSVQMKINGLQKSQWFGLGLSLDNQMGDDHVFVCKRSPSDEIILERYITPSIPSAPQPAGSEQGGTMTATSTKLDDSVVSCEFTLSNFPGSKRQRRALAPLSQSTSYQPLIAIGNCDPSTALIKHTTRTALNQPIQLNRDETINYQVNPNDSERPGLMKGHGIIMIFTWILLVPTGILFARYFKPVWSGEKFCGKAYWFSFHRAIMTTAMILTIIGFILILSYENGQWVSRDSQREYAHSIIGIIIICFTIIQPIMALYRCKPGQKYRFIFNYTHRTIGLLALILSIIAIFLAMFFTELNFQHKEWGIMVAWTCWIVLIFLIFEIINYYFKKNDIENQRTDSYDIGHDTQPNNESKRPTDNTQHDRIKLIFLIIHMLVAFGISLALAILVGLV